MKNTFIYIVLLCYIKQVDVNSVSSQYDLNNVDFSNEEIDLTGNTKNGNIEIDEKRKTLEKEFFEKENVLCKKSLKKYDDFKKSVDNYVQRYLSLFLISSNLVNYEVTDLNEKINIDMEISVSGEDLAFLQSFSKRNSNVNFPKDFSKLDSILSKIARNKERDLLEKAMRSTKDFFINFNYDFNLLNHRNIYHLLPFLIMFAVAWIFYVLYFNKRSFYIFLVIMINCMIFWESVIMYRKKLREAELEIHVKTLRLKEIPKDCYPENIYWYNSLSNYIFGDNCLQYYKVLHQDPVEEVSFFQCIIDTYALYFFQMPLKFFGSSVKEFSNETMGALPFPFNLFYIPMVPVFTIILGVFLLILFGKQLRFSFFGSSIVLGDEKSVLGKERPKIGNNIHHPSRESKKPRPKLRSSRFPRLLYWPRKIVLQSPKVCYESTSDINDDVASGESTLQKT